MYLPNICRDGGGNTDEVHLTDSMHNDPLETLLFYNLDTLEGHRRMLLIGSGISRKRLSMKFVKSVSRHLCKACAKAKITRHYYYSTDPDRRFSSSIYEVIIISSREKYTHVPITCRIVKEGSPIPPLSASNAIRAVIFCVCVLYHRCGMFQVTSQYTVSIHYNWSTYNTLLYFRIFRNSHNGSVFVRDDENQASYYVRDSTSP